MNKTILALSLVAALAACNRGEANNAATAGNAANAGTGLSIPPARPSEQTAQQPQLPAGLDCVRNRLSPEQRRAVAQVAMEQASPDDPRAQPLVQAVDSCTEELSWSPRKRQLAGRFSVSAAGAAGLREELSGQGVAVAELDQLIVSDRELMAAAENGQLDSAAGTAFAARHFAALGRIAGGGSLEGELGTRIGNYIAFRALAETLAAQFGREP